MISEERKEYNRKYHREYQRNRRSRDAQFRQRQKEIKEEWRKRHPNYAQEFYARYPEKWQRKLDRNRAWKKSNKQRMRDLQLKQRYGLEPGEFEAILAGQSHSCAVCKTPQPTIMKGWVVDHCHRTGIVRGILCHHCNVMLGYAKDDATRLRLAADYLERN